MSEHIVKILSPQEWNSVRPLPEHTSFSPHKANMVSFKVDKDGGWNISQNHCIFIAHTEMGVLPIKFDENQQPYYKPAWRLLWAIKEREAGQISQLIKQGCPLDVSLPGVFQGKNAFTELVRRYDKEVASSRLNTYISNSLDIVQYSDSSIRSFLNQALSQKRLDTADLIFKKIGNASSEEDQLATLLDFLSPVGSYVAAYKDESKSQGFDEWLMDKTHLWLDRLLPIFPFEEKKTLNVRITGDNQSTADISFDPFGALLFYRANKFKSWRNFVFERLSEKCITSGISWNCEKDHQKLDDYPSGKWTVPDVLRWCNMEEQAAQLEKKQMQELPAASSLKNTSRI